MNEKWLTVKDVADYLQLSTDLIYKLAQQGKIPAVKVESRWRFKKEWIDRWMEERSNIEAINSTFQKSPSIRSKRK